MVGFAQFTRAGGMGMGQDVAEFELNSALGQSVPNVMAGDTLEARQGAMAASMADCGAPLLVSATFRPDVDPNRHWRRGQPSPLTSPSVMQLELDFKVRGRSMSANYHAKVSFKKNASGKIRNGSYHSLSERETCPDTPIRE
jgi:hypothetical protein